MAQWGACPFVGHTPPETLAVNRALRTRAYRHDAEMRASSNKYTKRGYAPLDAVSRSIEDLFPTSPDQVLVWEGISIWKMTEGRLYLNPGLPSSCSTRASPKPEKPRRNQIFPKIDTLFNPLNPLFGNIPKIRDLNKGVVFRGR